MSIQHQSEIPIAKSYREIQCSCNRNHQPRVHGIPIAKSYREIRCSVNDSSHCKTCRNPQPRVHGIPIAKSYREIRCSVNDSSHRQTCRDPQPRAGLRSLRLSWPALVLESAGLHMPGSKDTRCRKAAISLISLGCSIVYEKQCG